MTSTPIRRLAAPIVAVALACVAAPAAASDPPPAPGADAPPSPAEAGEALSAAQEAVDTGASGGPQRGASPALAALANALPALSGRERRRARSLLARPTDGAQDQFGDGYTARPGHLRHTESPAGSFCITWVRSGSDAPELTDSNRSGTPDYVEAVGLIAEHSQQVQVGDLGWRPPKPDRRDECGSSSQTDIYLKNLGDQGLFGYAAIDPGQGNARARHGYLVIDDDYSRREFSRFDNPLDAGRVTIAHELNHLLQYAYSAHQEPWMLEATATWMEEKIFPDVDDYLNYVPAFARTPGKPITGREAGELRAYGIAVWNHWLENGDGGYGPDVVRRAWEVSGITSPRDFAIGAYGRAIVDSGGPGFARELVGFAASTAEWRTGAFRYPDAAAYPDVRRRGGLRPARRRGRAFRLDHTAYRLLHVPPVAASRIRLGVRAQRGVRSGLALVARSGGPLDGEVVRRIKFVPRGGNASVALRDPRRYERITAVVVNADARLGRSSFRRGERRYLKDGQRFRARLIRRR